MTYRSPWSTVGTPLPRDREGRILDGNGRILGDLRQWDTEPRAIRESAMEQCGAALAGAPLSTTIGTNPVVTLTSIAQASPETGLVIWASNRLAEHGHHGAAMALRSLAKARHCPEANEAA